MNPHREVIIRLHGAPMMDEAVAIVIVTVIVNVTDIGAVNERADGEDQNTGHHQVVTRPERGEGVSYRNWN